MKSFKKILNDIAYDGPDVPLGGITSDTRTISEGSLFVAFKGLHFDARNSIPEAVKKGAKAVIYEDTGDGFTVAEPEVPCVAVKNLPYLEADLASSFYEVPSEKLALIGITGTNGKSTTTHLIAEWATALGKKTGVLGTLGTGFYPNLTPSPNTTLRPLALEKILSDMKDAGAEAAAMEVSSHGLAQGRVRKLHFSYAGFTNLTRDHLDFHKTMENYREAKYELFKMVSSEHAVINAGDETGRLFLERLPDALAFATKPIQGYKKQVFASDIVCHQDGITVKVDGSFGKATLEVPLIGRFNAENLLCAMSILLEMGFSITDLAKTAGALHPVCGRMECFRTPGKPMVIVDYAHTPDGLEKALMGAREHKFGRITCVVGCGGDRDQGKRPEMAHIACSLSDHVIFTDDNPRTEDHNAILKMMTAGVPDKSNWQVISDRETAIRTAFKNSASGDVVLVAGKGHEDYQIIGTVKHHYSDREIAKKLTGDEND